jgi:hypothetical protein
MYKLVDTILLEFKSCFKRFSTFKIFVIIVIGMLMRKEHRGISSIVSTLRLKPRCYDNLLHFFRSKAFELADLERTWVKSVAQHVSLLTIDERLVMIGDNIKVVKEAKHMPAVKKLHQDSENAGKAEFINGHNHGIVGIVAQNEQQLSCIPLAAEIQDGIKQIHQMTQDSDFSAEEEGSIISKMVNLAAKSALYLGRRCFLVLDAYFASNVAFETAANFIDNVGRPLLTLIIRAKANYVAFKPVEKTESTKKRGRGRPAKYGEKVNLKKTFHSRAKEFRTAKVSLYGKLETIEYLCLDLLWKSSKGMIRFVLVKHGTTPFILMCNDLSLSPLYMIELYGYRFKVEVTFKSLKHTIGGFFYHFWTAALPKFSRKTTETDLSQVTHPREKARIVATAKAIEVFVFIGCVALGMLQIIALRTPSTVWSVFPGWWRTRKASVVSPETVRFSLQEELLWNFRKLSKFSTLKFIHSLQRESLYLYADEYDQAS